MESTFDFNSLREVKRVITRKTEDASSIGVSRTRNKKTGRVTFHFSKNMIDDLSLQVNSLQTFVAADKSVILAVVPGNTGNFFKIKKDNKSKGDKIIHDDLSASLDEAGYSSSNRFYYTKLGQKDSKIYYKLEPLVLGVQSESPETVKAEAVTA